MSTPQSSAWGPSREPVIVGIDGSTGAQSALHEAVLLAKAFGRRLEAVCVWQHSTSISGGYRREPGTSHKVVALEAAHAAAHEEFGDNWPSWFTVRTIEGNPAESLVKASETASHLVVGSRGRGRVTSAFLGSVSLYCASQAHCPVVVVGANTLPIERDRTADADPAHASRRT